MGLLLDLYTGASQLLGSRNLVGRSPVADVRVALPGVRDEHAVIVWDADGWRVHDLGGGVRVDGVPVPALGGAPLTEGAVIGLVDGVGFRLEGGGAPTCFAFSYATRERVAASGDELVFPSDAPHAVRVWRDVRGRWISDSPQRCGELFDGAVVAAGGAHWRLSLPSLEIVASEVSIRSITLEFLVSRDQEHVHLAALHGDTRIDLEARAHNYPLLVLAQERLRDQLERPDDPHESHGWVYQDLVRRQCGGRSDANLNLAIYRARRFLGECGIAGAETVVERRIASRQLRIGVERLVVRSI